MNELLNSIHITPLWYLIPSLLMFCAGVYGFLTRKNLIAMLISIELMLNAVDINFVVFNRYFFPHSMEGMFFTLFAIAIIINIYRAVHNVDVTSVNEMKF